MKMKQKFAVYSLTLATSALLLGGCATIQNASKGTKGTVIGASAGAGLGALIGSKAGNTAVGALAGAVIGGAAGNLIGKKMDKQAKEIENTVAGAQVEKVGEGILVKFDSGILFDFNKATLKPDAKTNIAKLVETLNKEPGTEILVVGHTDSIGTLAANNKVSIDRAKSVRDYAVSQGLAANRIRTEGKNYSEPIASNDTEAGRAKNRRVEVVIVAGKKMQAEAKQEAGQQ